MSTIEMLIRAVIIASSAGVNLDDRLGWWISGVLGLVAMVATIELAVRPYGKEIFDRLLLMAGGLVTAFVVLGIALNFTPWGLSLGSWNIAWSILSVLVLIWRRGDRTVWLLPRKFLNLLSLSIIVAAVIIVGAGFLALDGVKALDAKSVLSFSLFSSTSTSITTEINATSLKGEYSIVAHSSVSSTSRYTGRPFEISAGNNGMIIREQIPITTRGTWIIDLKSASSDKIIRELIVDVH